MYEELGVEFEECYYITLILARPSYTSRLITGVSCLQENQYNKMEKADILELTVKYLKNLQRQSGSLSTLPCPDRDQFTHFGLNDVQQTDNFRDGFRGCANEVLKYLNNTGLSHDMRDRLNNYLRSKIEGVRGTAEQGNNNNNMSHQRDTGFTGLASQTPVIQTLPVLQPVTLLNGQTIYVASNALSALSPVGTIQPTGLAPGSTINTTPLLATVLESPMEDSPSAFSPASSISSGHDRNSEHCSPDPPVRLDNNGNKLMSFTHSHISNPVPICPKPAVITHTTPTQLSPVAYYSLATDNATVREKLPRTISSCSSVTLVPEHATTFRNLNLERPRANETEQVSPLYDNYINTDATIPSHQQGRNLNLWKPYQ